MKKLQSYSDLENSLKKEKVPYADHKEAILDNLYTYKTKGSHISRKAMIICFSVLLFVSITTAAIATKGFGFLSISTDILTTLYDTDGNLVYEIGIQKAENKEEYGKHKIKQHNIHENFKSVYKSLEKDLPNDRIGLVIPVKNLDDFTGIVEILNTNDTYTSIKDMHNDGNNVPVPSFLPNGYTFSESQVFYSFEQLETDCEVINQIFADTKASGKDYYYKEYDRYSDFRSISLTYSNKKGKMLYLFIKKGKGYSISGPVTIITTSSGTTKFQNSYSYIKKNKYNEREYAVDYATENHPTYYSYFYNSGELWNITVATHTSVEAEDIIKMVESMSN